MGQRSLGLIETYGLLPAVEAADAAVKSANVELVGYEFAKGSGMTVVKVEGDVGAVKAAVAAASMAAGKVGRVAATRVIPRPATGLEAMVRNADTKGYTPPEPPESPPPQVMPDDSGPAPESGGEETTEQEESESESSNGESVIQEPAPEGEPAPAEEVQPESVPVEAEEVSQPEPVKAEGKKKSRTQKKKST